MNLRLLPIVALLVAGISSAAIADVSTRQAADGRAEIFVSGEITPSTRDSVTTLIRTARHSGTIYFDSIGGDLVAGMELGREIRRSGFATDVGRRTATSRIDAGKCHSVCTLSYAGGYYRYLLAGSQLGVHRFYRNSMSALDLDVGQVMSAAVTSYIDEMGIDRELFDVMVKAGRGQMLVLSREQIQRFRMANYGFQPPTWRIEGAKGLVYLKGEQESFNGIGKILVSCTAGSRVKISALYNAGVNNRSIIAGARHYTFRINDRFLPINQMLQAPTISGEYIVASFVPDANLLSGINIASHIGFGYHGNASDTFHGFLVDKRGEDDLISSWFNHCQTL
jgi:hypothetical protein